MSPLYGATPQEWDHFSLILGLTSDLLPVVSNPDATISPQSKLQTLGKIPSRYNQAGQVAGFANWTRKEGTSAEVAVYRNVPDYGICIQTRHVRALDVDIDGNQVLAADIHEFVARTLAQVLPCRRRADSSKFLLAFILDGEYSKRIIHTDQGDIEFLANGQQFVAVGTHPSGTKYEWAGGLPDDIPVLDAIQFEELWRRLTEAYATDGTSDVTVPTIRHTKITEAAQNDPIAQSLFDKGVVIATERDGRLHIVCPFEAEHTTGRDVSSTTYFPAFTGGFERGHFRCLHAHCGGRTDADFLSELGLSTGSDANEFEVSVPNDNVVVSSPSDAKYVFQSWADFINAKPPTWHVKGVLPEAALVVIYGAPSTGKTFFALDLGFAVAQGVPWRGLRVKQGTVAYIAAEDAQGVRMRAKAYADEHKVSSMPFYILGAAPNFRDFADMTQVAKAAVALGDVSLIFVDTWSRALAGGDENSAKDVGEAVTLCAKLHRATGATIVLIHHSGKDTSKGARGSTALLGACDAEIEVSRMENDREAQVTKLKNAQDGGRYAFRLRVVPVGLDDDGDVVSSCVLEHVAAGDKPVGHKDNRTGPNEDLYLAALDAVPVKDRLALEVYDAAVADKMLVAPGASLRSVKGNMDRAVESLKKKGRIEHYGENNKFVKRVGENNADL